MGEVIKSGGKRRLTDRLLDAVELAGNKLPDPIMLFALICVLIVLASWSSLTGRTYLQARSDAEDCGNGL